MAQSEIQSPDLIKNSFTKDLAPSSAAGERRLRRISAWLMLFFLLQGELGAAWDREWHAYVGRDQFWTPPHTLIYSCAAGAGLIALAVVLIDTFRYFKGVKGVDDTSTIKTVWFFHAPLGFVVAGFGALIALGAAPLDNYWHELYGIDIALWAPFHMMGVTGAVIGILGIIYAFASEATIQRRENKASWNILGVRPLELGAIMTAAGLLNFTVTGFLQFPVIDLGALQISTYPLPFIACGMVCMIGMLRFTQRPGTATLVSLLLLSHTFVSELFVPWAVRVAVAQQELLYRVPEKIPTFSLAYAVLPLAYLVSSLLIDLVAWRQQQRGLPLLASGQKAFLIGIIATPPQLLLLPYILSSYSPFAPIFLPQPRLVIPLALALIAVPLALLAALIMGGLGAVLGYEFGDIWRWNTR